LNDEVIVLGLDFTGMEWQWS